MKRLLFSLGLMSVLGPSLGLAQGVDAPTSVPVTITGEGIVAPSGGEQSVLYVAGSVVGDDSSALLFAVNPCVGAHPCHACTLQLQLGQSYTFQFSGCWLSSVVADFTVQSNYTVLINGRVQSSISFSVSGNNWNEPVTICVVGSGQYSGRAGSCTSIISGEIYWQVALGGLENGGSAGSITLIDPGTEGSWSAAFTPADLQYASPSAEVIPFTDGSGNLRQILANQADVDIVTISSNFYELRFYNPSQLQGSGFPYTFSGLPYVTYQITQVGTGTELQITSITHLASGLSTGSLSSTQPDPGTQALARIATTTLTLTGSGTSGDPYVWTLNDWNTSGQTQLVQEQRTWGSNSTGPTEVRVVSPPAGTEVTTVSKQYVLTGFGQLLTSLQRGSSSTAVTTNYAYGSYGLLQSVATVDGRGRVRFMQGVLDHPENREQAAPTHQRIPAPRALRADAAPMCTACSSASMPRI